MKFSFAKTEPPPWVSAADWQKWGWHFKKALSSKEAFLEYFELTKEENEGFKGQDKLFQIRVTPYYAELARHGGAYNPVRKMIMPHALELKQGAQQMLDPLGERENSPTSRVIHRYPDRVLFLVTDLCSVYCRYCTRKHFTGQEQAFIKSKEYEQALNYIKEHKEICEVILSGGDPLSLSDGILERVLTDIRSIEHIEIIRIGTRMPVVCPMRVTDKLVQILKAHGPLFLMTHFNHPMELTFEAVESLAKFVDNGIPVFNQMVLLKDINDSADIVKELSRKLLYLRVKPYYMFQCDPSEGTDHLRTSIKQSMAIQRELWGKLSGLAMPNLSLDIPGGGGKVGLVPNFMVEQTESSYTFKGWDGITGTYVDP